MGTITAGQPDQALSNLRIHRPWPPPPIRWAALNDIEQKLLLTAGNQGLLRDACASWVPVAERRGPTELRATRAAAARLLAESLIDFYGVADGYPDLPSAQVQGLFASLKPWDAGHEQSATVGMVLTALGEDVLVDRAATWAGHPAPENGHPVSAGHRRGRRTASRVR